MSSIVVRQRALTPILTRIDDATIKEPSKLPELPNVDGEKVKATSEVFVDNVRAKPPNRSVMTSIFADVSHETIKEEPWYEFLSFVSVVDTNHAQSPHIAGLKRLAFALILDATDVLTSGEIDSTTKTYDTQRSADRSWVSYDGTGLLSFRWCCEILEVDYRRLRKMIWTAMDSGKRISTNRRLAHNNRHKSNDVTVSMDESSVPESEDAMDVFATVPVEEIESYESIDELDFDSEI